MNVVDQIIAAQLQQGRQQQTHRPPLPATKMHPMDMVALSTMFAPVLGDITGLAADARQYAQEPESRTPGNFGLSALGLLPFVPGHTATKALSSEWTEIPAPGWSRQWGEVSLPVVRNPSKHDLLNLMLEQKTKTLRSLETQKGDLYVWPADKAVHRDIEEYFKLPFITKPRERQKYYGIITRDDL